MAQSARMNAALLDSPNRIRSAMPSRGRVVLAVATDAERETIYRLRHEVYAEELAQHAVNGLGELRDSLDGANIYLVAREGENIAGFISLTPPRAGRYSIDKYFTRGELPFAIDARTYEVRLLTVLKSHRGRELALLLMYAAYRWMQSHGGERVVAIGRREILDLYLRVGLKSAGLATQSGAVTYDLLTATVGDFGEKLAELSGMILRVEQDTDWQLNFPFRQPAACFHGGEFFRAIGERFETLERSADVINADVLDAWFPPAPGVLSALQEYLPWLLRTSPPTGCEGLVAEIARARGVAPQNILPGAGSSDLIFRALRQWLTPDSRVLILDPTYGEYAHVLERVIGCVVDRLPLERADGYAVNLKHLRAAFADDYDLIVLVNPNSPTGQHIPRHALEALLQAAPARPRVWIDETYVEYAGPGQSLETFAAASENVIVCKSMSKVYALSGVRAAYICAGAHQLDALRAITPPWVVSLPAQVAAVRALQDPDYYTARYEETVRSRETLALELAAFGWEIIPGIANFLLCHLPDRGPTAAAVVARCREHGLFLRDAAVMGATLGPRALRLAVKHEVTNRRMVEILRTVLD